MPGFTPALVEVRAPSAPVWRVLLQRPVTGTWLHTDVQTADTSYTRDLSGPGVCRFRVPAHLADAKGDDGDLLFKPYGTNVFVEVDRSLRWGGILTPFTGGGSFEAIGYTGYPPLVPYEGAKIETWAPDAFDLVRTLWSWMQSAPDRDLGIRVDSHDAGIKVGDPKPPPKPVWNRRKGESKLDADKRFDAAEALWREKYGSLEPYRLAWWDGKTVGDEIDNLAREVPFDYIESHRWTNRDTLAMEHRLRLGTPLIRRRRDDIRLVEGQNATITPAGGGGYATHVQAFGAGEGSAMIRTTQGRTPPGSLRVTRNYVAKNVTALSRLAKVASAEWSTLQAAQVVASASAVDTTGYGSLATVEPGDEVFVEANRVTTWQGWCLVTSVTANQGGGYQFDFGKAS